LIRCVSPEILPSYKPIIQIFIIKIILDVEALTAIEIYTSLAILDSRLAEAASGCGVVWLFLIILTH
jgi:hypothetical protein